MKQSILILFALFFYCYGMPQVFLPFSNFPTMETPDLGLDIFPKFDKNKMNKTTKTEKLKDGTEITTTNINGPNFMVHEESAIKSSDKLGGKGNKLDIASSFSPLLLKGFPFGGLYDNLRPKKCTPKCKEEKEYCNEDIGKCVPTLKSGYDCQQDKECQSGLLCVWGVCNEAKSGDAGTLCTKKDDCKDNRICWSHNDAPFSKKHCIPKLSEGAVCGSGTLFGTIGKADINPCGDGLKCSNVGSSGNKICVKSSYKGSNEFLIETKDGNESSGDDKNEDDSSGEEDDDDNEEKKMPVKTADGKVIPGSHKKNKNKGGKKTKSSTTTNKKGGKKDNYLKFKG